MNVNSSTYYSASSTKSSSNKGLSGLMSGMDTEAMVEKMLSGTQNKIDKQEQLKQQTLWKQEIYRDIITNVNGFYSKFFDASYGSSLKNNFASDSFFNSMVSSVRSGDALRVISTSSNALASDMKVAVKQLASTSSLQSSTQVSPKKIEGKVMTDAKLQENLNKTVALKVNGTDVTIDLNRVTTESELLAAFNDKLSGEGFTAKIVDGRMRLVTEDPANTISIDTDKSTAWGVNMSGLSSGLYQTTGEDLEGNTVTMFKGGQLQPAAGPTMTLTLDGVAKTISLNDVADKTTGVITAESVLKSVQDQVKQVFGDYIKVEDANTTTGELQLKFSVTADGGKGHELRVTGMEAGTVGLTAGSSTLLNTSSTLGELKDALGLQGDRFSFSINGQDFSFTSEQSLSTVINTVNNSNAGVKLSYSALSDTFRMEATSSGSKYGIDVKQKEGNLLSAIFDSGKIANGTAVGSDWLTTGTVEKDSRVTFEDGFETMTASLSMTVNGRSATFTLPPKTGIFAGQKYTKDEIVNSLNAWLGKNYGTTGTTTEEQNIYYDKASGNLVTKEGMAVSFNQTKVDLEDPEAVKAAKESDLGLAMGFTTKAATNISTGGTTIGSVLGLKDSADLSIFKTKDGSAVGADTRLDNLAGVTIGGTDYALDYSNGRFTLSGGTGTVDFTSQPELAKLFGDSVTLGTGATDAAQVAAGKDAEFYVNGILTTRSSNNFTIDGVTMELTKTSAADAANTATGGLAETVIGTSRDTDSIVEGFKSFVEEYNKMIDKVSGYLYEDADYRDYAPLTAAQRKEMSESEVENWEKKAKTGLIRSDDTVTRMLSTMRAALYSAPEGSRYALYSIGVETTDGTKTGGRLKLDETALRDALSADPDAVRQLFTNTTEGLAKQLTGAMDSMTKTKGANPGELVQMAGMPNTTSEKSSSMYVKLKDIENKIKDLKTKYEKERARYWNQFNSMESVLANYNSQSAYIAQQFGGY